MRWLAVALLIRSVLVEPFKIPSGSMIPTLEIGDQIFVNKFIYGVRVPFLDVVPFVIVREPKKSDVIVFYNRLVGKDFIKRIIATPGDHVVIHGRTLLVNGAEVASTVEAEDYRFWDQRPCEQSFFECIPHWFQNDWEDKVGTLKRETIEAQPHLIIHQLQRDDITERDFVVPPRSVFVMGDDRDNSADGRFGLAGPNQSVVAFVPYDDIKGKATVIWLSLSHGGLFDSIFGGTGIRGDRFFRSVTMCGNEPVRR
jgi:signal peptidase I